MSAGKKRVSTQIAASWLFWPWLLFTTLGVLWAFVQKNFSEARITAYLVSGFLPMLGSICTYLFADRVRTRYITVPRLYQVIAISVAFMVLLIGVPMIICVDIGGQSLPPIVSSEQQDEDSVSGRGDAARNRDIQNSQVFADRKLDYAWTVLAIFMGLVVFAHGRILGRDSERSEQQRT
jgi:hypothetical protein